MSPRRLLIAVFASALMLPVSCSVVTLPMTRLLSQWDARDLRAGEASHFPPAVAMVDAAAPGDVVVVPLEALASRRAATPALSAWLPTPDGSSGEGDDRTVWRQVASSGGGREMEVVRVVENYTHTFRYAVTPDGAITPLHSKLFSVGHLFAAIPFGVAVALALFWMARRARKRLAATPPPR